MTPQMTPVSQDIPHLYGKAYHTCMPRLKMSLKRPLIPHLYGKTYHTCMPRQNWHQNELQNESQMSLKWVPDWPKNESQNWAQSVLVNTPKVSWWIPYSLTWWIPYSPTWWMPYSPTWWIPYSLTWWIPCSQHNRSVKVNTATWHHWGKKRRYYYYYLPSTECFAVGVILFLYVLLRYHW